MENIIILLKKEIKIINLTDLSRTVGFYKQLLDKANAIMIGTSTKVTASITKQKALKLIKKRKQQQLDANLDMMPPCEKCGRYFRTKDGVTKYLHNYSSNNEKGVVWCNDDYANTICPNCWAEIKGDCY